MDLRSWSSTSGARPSRTRSQSRAREYLGQRREQRPRPVVVDVGCIGPFGEARDRVLALQLAVAGVEFLGGADQVVGVERERKAQPSVAVALPDHVHRHFEAVRPHQESRQREPLTPDGDGSALSRVEDRERADHRLDHCLPAAGLGQGDDRASAQHLGVVGDDVRERGVARQQQRHPPLDKTRRRILDRDQLRCEQRPRFVFVHEERPEAVAQALLPVLTKAR